MGHRRSLSGGAAQWIYAIARNDMDDDRPGSDQVAIEGNGRPAACPGFTPRCGRDRHHALDMLKPL